MTTSKTLKLIPKAKIWYKYLKSGDKILVQLHPNHTWYHNIRDEKLIATIDCIYDDGCISCDTEKSLSIYSTQFRLLIGPEGTDWDDIYPATIIKKIKPAK